jgi:endonuclease III
MLRVEGVRRLLHRIALVASPWDAESIAIAVFLSRRTSYVANVLRWVRTLLRDAYDPETGRVDTDAIRKRARTITSYQVQQLIDVLDELIDSVRWSGGGAEEVRRRLLQVPYVGPKVADATLLFTGLSCRVAPYDTHLSRLLSEEGIPHKQPSKTMCLRYGANCLTCSYRRYCGTGVTVERYGEWSGLIQTAAYVYYSLKGELSRLERILRRFSA